MKRVGLSGLPKRAKGSRIHVQQLDETAGGVHRDPPSDRIRCGIRSLVPFNMPQSYLYTYTVSTLQFLEVRGLHFRGCKKNIKPAYLLNGQCAQLK